MKNRALFAALAAVLFAGATTFWVQADEQAAPGAEKKACCKKGGDAKECDKAAMDECKKQMDEMKAMDTKLDELVAKLDSSAADQKVDALAAVVKELVAQRKSMHSEMMQHCEMEMKENK